jgi:hypothetical protein
MIRSAASLSSIIRVGAAVKRVVARATDPKDEGRYEIFRHFSGLQARKPIKSATSGSSRRLSLRAQATSSVRASSRPRSQCEDRREPFASAIRRMRRLSIHRSGLTCVPRPSAAPPRARSDTLGCELRNLRSLASCGGRPGFPQFPSSPAFELTNYRPSARAASIRTISALQTKHRIALNQSFTNKAYGACATERVQGRPDRCSQRLAASDHK